VKVYVCASMGVPTAANARNVSKNVLFVIYKVLLVCKAGVSPASWLPYYRMLSVTAAAGDTCLPDAATTSVNVPTVFALMSADHG
jgi:hypothetical protein